MRNWLPFYSYVDSHPTATFYSTILTTREHIYHDKFEHQKQIIMFTFCINNIRQNTPIKRIIFLDLKFFYDYYLSLCWKQLLYQELFTTFDDYSSFDQICPSHNYKNKLKS